MTSLFSIWPVLFRRDEFPVFTCLCPGFHLSVNARKKMRALRLHLIFISSIVLCCDVLRLSAMVPKAANVHRNSGNKVCSTWKFFTVSLSFFVYRLPQFDCRSTPKQHRRRMSLCLGKWSPLTETRRVRMLLTPQVKS